MGKQGFVTRLIVQRRSDDQGSVTRLISRLRSDNADDRNEAARVIWHRYFHALLALARDNLHARIRCRENEEDVLQDMYASFCRRQRRGEFDLAGRDELWGLLVRITLCKVRNTANKHARKRRDIGREQAWSAGVEAGALSKELHGLQDRGPAPDEAALLNESLEQRLALLGDPDLRSLALRKLEGWTNAEIAATVGRTERSIERKLKRIRECWRDEEPGLFEPPGEPTSEGCGP